MAQGTPASIPMGIGSVSVFAHTLAVDTLHAPHPLLQLSFHTAATSTLLSVGQLRVTGGFASAGTRSAPMGADLDRRHVVAGTLMLWIAVRDRENIVRFEEASTANPGAAA